MELRELKALELAARTRIEFDGKAWVVPSQSSGGTYRVSIGGELSCTCEDFQLRREACKHVIAARLVCERDHGGKAPAIATDKVPKKPTYKQDWPKYDLAQRTEKHRFQELLADLCRGVNPPEPEKRGRGRPQVPLGDKVFAAAYKVFSTVSARRFGCDLKDAHERGHVSHLMNSMSIPHYLEDEKLTPILQGLIVRSSLPLKAVETTFATDSTGFSASRFVRWHDEKYGTERSGHDWVKAHASPASPPPDLAMIDFARLVLVDAVAPTSATRATTIARKIRRPLLLGFALARLLEATDNREAPALARECVDCLNQTDDPTESLLGVSRLTEEVTRALAAAAPHITRDEWWAVLRRYWNDQTEEYGVAATRAAVRRGLQNLPAEEGERFRDMMLSEARSLARFYLTTDQRGWRLLTELTGVSAPWQCDCLQTLLRASLTAPGSLGGLSMANHKSIQLAEWFVAAALRDVPGAGRAAEAEAVDTLLDILPV